MYTSGKIYLFTNIGFIQVKNVSKVLRLDTDTLFNFFRIGCYQFNFNFTKGIFITNVRVVF